MAQRITKWQAERIGEKIAEKAFQHLTVPVQARQKEVAVKIYNELMNTCFPDDVTLKTMEDLDLIKPSHSIEVRIKNQAGQSMDIDVRMQDREETARYWNKDGWGSFNWVSDTLYSEYADVAAELQGFERKERILAKTITGQCSGKSVATVAKAWPEATGIIEEVVGHIEGGSLTTPLEQLLAKFLPMLPAPTAA